MAKINVQCTNCNEIFEIDTDSIVVNICPHCGHQGDIKFRRNRHGEDDDHPKYRVYGD